MKTTWNSNENIKRDWYVIDLDGKVLGRAAVKIAETLMGKGKIDQVSNLDCGDYVIAINASKVRITGNNKPKQKMYYRHSGYPGALKSYSFEQMIKEHPDRVITEAVKNMLPKNKLQDRMMARLKVYAGAEHGHEAQKPIELK